jgi:hypothetical protein
LEFTHAEILFHSAAQSVSAFSRSGCGLTSYWTFRYVCFCIDSIVCTGFVPPPIWAKVFKNKDLSPSNTKQKT